MKNEIMFPSQVSVSKMFELEEQIKQHNKLHPEAEVTPPLTHYFIKGVYVREMFIPAGTMLVGKIHNKENVSILSQGELKVSNGTQTIHIKAPHTMVDKPGVKRVGYAITDCTFINVFQSDTSEVEGIEKELASDTLEQYEQLKLGEQP